MIEPGHRLKAVCKEHGLDAEAPRVPILGLSMLPLHNLLHVGCLCCILPFCLTDTEYCRLFPEHNVCEAVTCP